MNKSFFITGTDTDIGKTFVSIGLCLTQESKGLKVGYFKPFQSGAIEKNEVLFAPDIEELKKYSSNIETKYSYLLKGEVSPYLASNLNNINTDLNKVQNDLKDFSKNKNFIICEGAGGILCPTAKQLLLADIISKLELETIIVTTPDLGRINHTLMTIECAKKRGIKIKGVIINKMPENKTLSQKNFIEELKTFSDIEILGIIPKLNNPTKEEIVDIFSKINL